MYMRKLSQKEQEEVVTKGFLVEYLEKTLEEKLESKNYVTKDYLEEVLESKNYITKDYLDSKNYITKDYFEEGLNKQSADFRQHLESLMEHQMDQLQVFMEQMDNRYVLRREWNAAKGL